MRLEPAYLFHIASGSLAVFLYWATLLQRKGSPRHKRNGRWFLAALAVVLASIGGIFFLSRRSFSPPDLVQFVYLTICLAMVAATAFMAIRLKHDLRTFRGLWFKAIGVAAFIMALAVLGAGLATRNAMPVIFSVIGLVYGGAMVRFAFMRSAPHPNWPLIWHLNGMTFLFNAVHGTLLAVAWRALVDPAAGPEVNMATQIGTMLGALALRIHFGRRFGAPLRLTAPRAVVAAA
jgi:hypothetical protein